jgi:hypothetical protein
VEISRPAEFAGRVEPEHSDLGELAVEVVVESVSIFQLPDPRRRTLARYEIAQHRSQRGQFSCVRKRIRHAVRRGQEVRFVVQARPRGSSVM